MVLTPAPARTMSASALALAIAAPFTSLLRATTMLASSIAAGSSSAVSVGLYSTVSPSGEGVEVRLGECVDDEDLHQLTTLLARSRSSTVSISRQPPSMNAGRITSPLSMRSFSRSVR